MSKTLKRKLLVYFFNLVNVLCLKFENNEVKISILLALKNLLYFPFLVIFRMFVTPNMGDHSYIKKESSIGPNQGLSIVFMYSFSVRAVTIFILNLICIYLNYVNRKRNLDLIRSCIRFYNHQGLFDDRQFFELERKFFQEFSIFIVHVFFLNYLEFVTMLYFSLKSILNFVLYPVSGFYILYFLALNNCFLQFFVFILKNTNDKLQNEAESMNISEVIFVINCLRNLILKFKNSSGFQLTFVIVCVICTQTIRVSQSMMTRQVKVIETKNFRPTSSSSQPTSSRRWDGRIVS